MYSHSLSDFTTDNRKFVTENLTTIIYRGCHYQEDGLPRDCLHTKYGIGIKTDYCLTCSTDGCNAALNFDLLKKSLLANSATEVGLSIKIFLIFVLMFYWFFWSCYSIVLYTELISHQVNPVFCLHNSTNYSLHLIDYNQKVYAFRIIR